MVRGAFLSYWRANGGLAQYGYPLSSEIQERSKVDNKTYTVQYFERAVFELHPENNLPYDVLLTLLGRFAYAQRYGTAGSLRQHASEIAPRHFRETGKTVGGQFRNYWEQTGGLTRFGYPLSDEFEERSATDGNTYLVQYFERAVFEYHPQNAEPHKVLLSLLGSQSYQTRQSTARPIGRIQTSSNMGTERACQTATLLPGGKVLVAGGIDSNETPLSSAEIYDPSKGTFATTGTMTTGRACHTATLLSSGRVLIAGGAGRQPLASAELYDPASGKFSSIQAMGRPRDGHRATMLPNGKVLITGGDNSGTSGAELYDPQSGKFTPTGNMVSRRSAHTATLLKDGKVLITGGSTSRTDVLTTSELYDPVTSTFTPSGSMLTPRQKHAAALLTDGTVLIVGGSDSRDWRGRYSASEIYNPATNRFSPASNMKSPRFKLTDAVVPLKNGMVLVAGGATEPEIFDPLGRLFQSPAGQLDAERFYMTATEMQDGRVLILGGYDTRIQATAKSWIYEP